jgi:hypothetical protein
LIEQTPTDLAVTQGSVTVHTKPYEIKTVKVRMTPNSRP